MTPIHPHPGARRGFTIVELLITMAIAVILLSIVILGVQQAIARARAAHTKAILLDAVAAAAQFQVATEGRGINHINKVDGALIDWTMCGNGNLTAADANSAPTLEPDRNNFAKLTTQRFLWKARKVPAVENTINKVINNISKPPGSTPSTGNQFLVDAWDQPIAYVFKNVRPDDPTNSDPKVDDFLPQQNGLYFASPGLDGKWGDARELLKKTRGQAVSNPDDAAAASDNLYSFVAD